MAVSELWDVVHPRLRASVEAGLSVEFIAEFCKVTIDTVSTWIKSEHPAKGEKLIRLWHLLALAGSDSPELDQMKPLQHVVSELFAFDVISAEKACEILNLTPDRPSHMYHILRGREVLKPKYTYEEIIAELGEELELHRTVTREEIDRKSTPGEMISTPVQTIVERMESAEVAAREPSNDATYGGDVKIFLASMVSAIRPVANALLSDDFTPEDRSKFREMLTDETLFEVTNALNALSSERARNKR